MRPNCLLASSLLSLLFPLASLAQTSEIVSADLSRGLTQPPTSAALTNESTAIAVNPAGLSYVGGLELSYLHERNNTQLETGDGVYLGGTFFDLVGAGFSVEWLRGAEASRRRTTWAASLGGQALSLGFSYSYFAAPDIPELSPQKSWTVGIEGRPSQYLAYGLVVRNVDEPSRGSLTLPRTWDVALASRPVGNDYQVAVDYQFQDSQSLGAGLGAGRFTYTVLASLVPGLTLGGGVSHGLNAGDPLALQLSLTLDASHLGATYALGGGQDGLDHLVGVRLSQRKYPSIVPGQNTVALFDLDELLTPETSTALTVLGVSAADPYLKFTELLDGAIRDPSLSGVILKVNPVGLGLGRAEELRGGIVRLRASGKKVMALLLSVEDSDYLFASAADRVFAVPESVLMVDGFEATPLFLGGAMDKLGVRWEVARVGAYKNAPDQLTRTGMSDEQREAINAYLDTDVKTFAAAVTAARGLTPSKLSEAIDEGLKTPRRAKELGLIDEVVSPEELDKKVSEWVPGGRFDPGYRPRSTRLNRWGFRPRVAIIPVLGNISGGKSQSGLSRSAGADTVIRALRAASEDPGVAAIVVRVDSGGGDGLASDLIYRAVLEAKKKKPVVASMGDVAASGGYYAAMGADEIWAEPTTITGSIGVFLLRPALEGLAQKVGVRQESIKRGKLAGLMNLYEPWTEAERAAAQAWVDAFYDDFITEVSRSRKMPKESVDAIARGRVWSGEDARARGLVDQQGGLLDAVDSARRRAGIGEKVDVKLEIVGEGGGLLGALGAESSVVARLLPDPPQDPLPEGLRRLAHDLGVEQALSLRPGMWAAMEYSLEVR